jgi:hypothetical protein
LEKKEKKELGRTVNVQKQINLGGKSERRFPSRGTNNIFF